MDEAGVTNVSPCLHAFAYRIAHTVSHWNFQLAPLSYFTEVNHDPPTIMISVTAGTNADGLKDTASNILNMKEFCVSMISEPMIEAANYSSINTPKDVDEYKLSGFTKRKSRHVSNVPAATHNY